MASERQISANRRNASRSTGPKTKGGKQRSSRNALRHGLTSQLLIAGSAELEALARLLLMDGDADPDCVELARDAARAHLKLVRIREVKADMLARIDQFGALEPAPPSTAHRLAEIKYVMKRVRELRVRLPAQNGHRKPMSEEEGTVEAMRRLLPELHRIDRYEERAFHLRQRCLRRLTQALNQGVR